MDPKDPSSDDNQDNLFASEMRGVVPLPPTDKVYFNKASSSDQYRDSSIKKNIKRSGLTEHPAANLADTLMSAFSDELNQPIESQAVLSFRRPGMQIRRFKRLSLGQLPIEAELDLHGYRLLEARLQLVQFLSSSLMNQYKVVLVIHGKGLHTPSSVPQLKSYVNQWLQSVPEVLAFVSAPNKLGGVGAVLVMLKSRSLIE